MKRIVLLACCSLLVLQQALAGIYYWEFSLPNPGIISSVTSSGGVYSISTSNSAVNSVLGSHTIVAFKQLYPASENVYMRTIWRIAATDSLLAPQLKAAAPALFPYYEVKRPAEVAYIPNDYFSYGNCSSYLDFINAPDAWDFTHGDPSVTIGITDTHVDDNHEDLYDKLSSILINDPDLSTDAHHGTTVCGFAAGHTDNGPTVGGPGGIASIGFDCRIEFSSNRWDDEMEFLSRKGNKILNASWVNDFNTESGYNLRNYFNGQEVYNKIYENGTSTVVAAGNSHLGWPAAASVVMPNGYLFPASYDNVLSVTNVGWANEPGTSALVNIKDVHDCRPYDDPLHDRSYARNSKVDICAPAVELSALDYTPGGPSSQYKLFDWGTSYASPIVAGTIGLMLSANPSLSPYQREFLLKKHANKRMFTLAENAAYAGKLGAGRLDAGAAVAASRPTIFKVNEAATQTMYIKGIEINTICAPGFASNGVKPKITPIIVNGTGPFTYVWEEVPDGKNTVVLDHNDIAEPTMDHLYPGATTYYFSYRLTVYDNSKLNTGDATPTAQKVAMKTFRINLKTSGPDLAMRDSYVDMGKEMNDQKDLEPREWDIWTSPDIWNRQTADGIQVHQNPEFKSTPNHVYTKVRNFGCAPSPTTSKLRLYWSKASTGENWDYDWKTTTVTACCSMPNIPGGLEITTGSGIAIPVLQPGDAAIISQPWHPIEPNLYEGEPTKISLCLLGRIEEDDYYEPGYGTHVFGMKINEIFRDNVKHNVRNNNNIVTRNMELTNLNTTDKRTERRQLIIANANNAAKVFNFEFASQRSIFKHFAGDFSSLGKVTLYLGDLYDRWDAAGGVGEYASKDAENRTVTFDGARTLVLEDIALDADERFTIEIEFALHGAVTSVSEASTHLFHARQFDRSNLQDVYGAVNYEITVEAGSQNTFRVTNQDTTSSVLSSNSGFHLSPNPTKGELHISYQGENENPANIIVTDMVGKKVMTEQITFSPGLTKEINLSRLSTGVYLINITNENGKTDVFKVVKE